MDAFGQRHGVPPASPGPGPDSTAAARHSTKAARPARRAALPRAEREKLILDAAAELFYARGIRAVGMDELIAVLGLSKMTVYRLFPTKDALVEAYLRRLRDAILRAIDHDVDAHAEDPAGALIAILDAIERDVAREGFRGCPFGNAAVDYDDPTHPARRLARDYREQLRTRLCRLSTALTGDGALGDRLAVVIDGIYLNAAHLGPDGPASAGLTLARQLVADVRAAKRTPPSVVTT